MSNDILLLLYLTHTFREKTLCTISNLFRMRFSTLELAYCAAETVKLDLLSGSRYKVIGRL